MSTRHCVASGEAGRRAVQPAAVTQTHTEGCLVQGTARGTASPWQQPPPGSAAEEGHSCFLCLCICECLEVDEWTPVVLRGGREGRGRRTWRKEACSLAPAAGHGLDSLGRDMDTTQQKQWLEENEKMEEKF